MRQWTGSALVQVMACRLLGAKSLNLHIVSSGKLSDTLYHDDVIKWKHFPRYWPFIRGTHRSSMDSPYKGQWRGALMFSLICAWINGWLNNREADDLRGYRAHDDVTVMIPGNMDSASVLLCFLMVWCGSAHFHVYFTGIMVITWSNNEACMLNIFYPW